MAYYDEKRARCLLSSNYYLHPVSYKSRKRDVSWGSKLVTVPLEWLFPQFSEKSLLSEPKLMFINA